MAEVKRKIGHIKCLCCGAPLAVKENATGTLDLSCRDCDLSAYAKVGTEANAKVRKHMTPIASAEPAPAPAPKPEPKAPPPAPAPTRSPLDIFSGLGSK